MGHTNDSDPPANNPNQPPNDSHRPDADTNGAEGARVAEPSHQTPEPPPSPGDASDAGGPSDSWPPTPAVDKPNDDAINAPATNAAPEPPPVNRGALSRPRPTYPAPRHYGRARPTPPPREANRGATDITDQFDGSSREATRPPDRTSPQNSNDSRDHQNLSSTGHRHPPKK